ncbi:MAG: hypothetical protein L0241_19235 [Planctomycetia bacterium]|nr:hypothetical protein [Planctomycetia bacterium]
MYRRLIPLAIAIALVVGCKKKTENTGGDGGGGEPEPTGPAITIKLRDDKVGDMVLITETTLRTQTANATGPKGKVSQSQKVSEKYEYTETILEMPAGSNVATKSTREYKVAEKSEDGGPMKPLSYANKTVLIQKQGALYTYTIDGAPIDWDEAKKFRDTYEKADKFKNEDMLPKKAVQLNEKWALDSLVVKKVAGELPFPINVEKSTVTGRLTKTYTKDQQQWGVLEIKIDLVVDGTKSGAKLSGNLGMTLTVDTAIDGSTLDGVFTTRMYGRIVATQAAAGTEAETILEGEGKHTRTTVK